MRDRDENAQDVLRSLNKGPKDSKKAVATATAGRHALAIAGGVLALAGLQVVHGTAVDWSSLGVFGALLIGAAVTPYGVQVAAQGRVDREVLVEIAKGDPK